MKYIHPDTNEEKTVKFPIHWLVTPLCALDLLMKGKVLHGLVGWIPLFTLIWLLQYKKILGSVLEKKGFVRAGS
jgi:hypothetical protein